MNVHIDSKCLRIPSHQTSNSRASLIKYDNPLHDIQIDTVILDLVLASPNQCGGGSLEGQNSDINLTIRIPKNIIHSKM